MALLFLNLSEIHPGVSSLNSLLLSIVFAYDHTTLGATLSNTGSDVAVCSKKFVRQAFIFFFVCFV